MTEFSSYDPGTPCWVDLMSPDVDASKAFYSAVFGWDAVDQFDPEGNRIYVNFRQNGKEVAGLGGQPPDMGTMPPVWNNYIATEDCEATAAKVTEAGGTVMMPPMQVMEAGSMAIFVDPTGAAFSVWQAGEHFGAQVANDPDTWSWSELMSRDIDTAKAFYSQVFGWAYDEMDMGPSGIYNVVKGGESGLAGLMNMPDEVPGEVPNHWAVYFMVDDIEATLAKIKDAGGQVVNGPFTIPGVGQTAVVHDDKGGNFSVMQAEAS
ncbi:MAG: VOC family protein [Acidimicrobiia bacterium]|nr:VOC family protein [Acidimicrobiia bacterium]